MTEKAEKPKFLNEPMLRFLDDLRASAQINMFDAGKYLSAEFGLTMFEARKVLTYWMETFAERNDN